MQYHGGNYGMQERKNMTGAARDLRISVLETAYHGGDANLQSVFSSIEILRVLYDRVLKISPETVDSPERD